MKKRKLKQLIWVVAVSAVVLAGGCSKKDEECTAAAAVYKSLDKNAFQINVDPKAKGGGANRQSIPSQLQAISASML